MADGTADLVAFGVLFLANANLPALLASGQVLDLASMARTRLMILWATLIGPWLML